MNACYMTERKSILYTNHPQLKTKKMLFLVCNIYIFLKQIKQQNLKSRTVNM